MVGKPFPLETRENGWQEMGQKVKEHVSAHLDFWWSTVKLLASYRFLL